jgi:hypothetical protein
MSDKSVLCDTSFLIRLLDKNSSLHSSARSYFKYFTENDYNLIVSTIAIAEYCVGGDVHELPLRNLQILPFNLDHSKRTGEFAKIIFQNKGTLKLSERNIIPNDTKLFAQADCEKTIVYFLSSDTESFKIYNLLRQKVNPQFQFLDLKIPYNQVFSILDL